MTSSRIKRFSIIFFLLILSSVMLTSAYLYTSVDLAQLQRSYPIPKFSRVPESFEIRKERPSHWSTLADISSALKGAIVVTEDWSFYEHSGVDFKQLKIALMEMIFEGKVRGASTITQQMVRTIFLSDDRTLWRKYCELLLTIKAENYLSKNRILEIYFNSVEFGPGITGVKEASEHYFKKSPAEITAREAAFLAMLLPSPVRYYDSFQKKQLTPFAKERVDIILTKMRMGKVISKEDYQKEKLVPFIWEDK